MTEDSEDHEGLDRTSPIAGAIVFGDKPLDPRAIAFLEKQSRLTDLQVEELEREDAVRHWNLRVRHVSGMMKLAFEFAAAFILLAAAGFLAVTVWTAAHDKSLVIDAFDVPPDLVERGLSGQVVAARIEDRLAWMQARTDTSRVASTYRHDWGDDIRVQIPQTGISFGELYHYLVGWLGDQTHITGDIWRTPQGLALVTRAGSNAAPVLAGKDSDLDDMLLKAAEQIYRRTQPYRYSAYLDHEGRVAEELEVTRDLALNGPIEERPWAYTRWGVALENLGDLKGAMEKQRLATIYGPSLPQAWYNLASSEAVNGLGGAAWRDNRRSLQLLTGSAAKPLASYAVNVDTFIVEMSLDEASGDFRDAIALAPKLEAAPEYGWSRASATIMLAADLAADHDVSGSRKVDHGTPDDETAGMQMGGGGNFELQPLPTFLRAAALGDWQAARDDLEMQDRSATAQAVAIRPLLPILTWPWLAYSEAKLGDVAAAGATIAKTPLDCDLCLRMRGNVEAAAGNASGAEAWFKRADSIAPSLPFADLDWGAMLLTRGDFEGAIAKFTSANRKGPHFADPLEMWGEALMAENRSDLALAKFEEADRYAPHWGRLHLKWGEALFYAGKPADAKAEFARASNLDLSARDRAVLAHWMTHNG